jgi:hypothetical protein
VKDKRGAPRGKGTVQANGGQIGNPPFEPTAEQRKLVESHAAVGTPHELIAELIINPATNEPISSDTLTRHFRKQLDQGLAKMNSPGSAASSRRRPWAAAKRARSSG